MPGLPEPVKVSPLIKFLRYSFLIAGIIYGASKLKALRILEEGRKEEKERKKAEREAKILEERKAASERDIAQIVAIFTGKPETESKITDQSYQPGTSKIETEEVKHTIDDEKSFSDDLSTCTVEEVKQMVQSDKIDPSPSVNTEFGSVNRDKSSVSDYEKGPDYKSEKESTDIFSDVFNVAPPKEKKRDSLRLLLKSKIISEDSGSTGREEAKTPSKEDGYYVEKFRDQIPYADPESLREEFFSKNDE